jgi:GNAT superfamily N-acetyltransferase
MVQVADNIQSIEKCRKVLLDLRPSVNEKEFVSIITAMIADGYKLVFIEENGFAVSAAGFVTGYNLYRGNYLYIDDLNTLPGYRKKGYAQLLMNWIFAFADENKIKQVHLDSGVNRFDAHRFYLNNRFIISSHHFSLIRDI